MDSPIDDQPQEIVLHCQVCDDPCVRTVLGRRPFVHYDELLTLDGVSNYDHEAVVSLTHPEIIEVKDSLDEHT
jgi:hypothetical protein